VALIEQVSQDVVTIPAEWSVSDAYGRLGGKQLFVEPLSAKQPFADFIVGGGLGWGSLRNGSFASKLYKVQTDKFTFGSNYSTSVNAGYPLHRLVEGMPHELCPEPQAKIHRVTVPVKPKPSVKAVFKACAVGDAVLPPPADDFIWVNAAAASTLGLSGAGSVAFFERFEPEGEGEPADGIYEKRFFEDAVPPGQGFVKVLTIKSNLPKLEEIAKANGRFFICLWTHLGVLVCISAESGKLSEIEKEAAKLPLTFGLPKKDGSARLYNPSSPGAVEEKPQEEAAKPAPKPEAKKEESPKKEEPKPAPAAEAPKTEEPAAKAPDAAGEEKKESQGETAAEPEKPAPEGSDKPQSTGE